MAAVSGQARETSVLVHVHGPPKTSSASAVASEGIASPWSARRCHSAPSSSGSHARFPGARRLDAEDYDPHGQRPRLELGQSTGRLPRHHGSRSVSRPCSRRLHYCSPCHRRSRGPPGPRAPTREHDIFRWRSRSAPRPTAIRPRPGPAPVRSDTDPPALPVMWFARRSWTRAAEGDGGESRSCSDGPPPAGKRVRRRGTGPRVPSCAVHDRSAP